MKTFKPVDLKKVRTSSLKDRKSLVEREKLGTACKSPVSFKNFLQSLPISSLPGILKRLSGGFLRPAKMTR
jgi:hypothetical protein